MEILPLPAGFEGGINIYSDGQGHSQKWLKEEVLRMRNHCRYSLDHHFVIILVKINKKMGSSDPLSPPWLANSNTRKK